MWGKNEVGDWQADQCYILSDAGSVCVGLTWWRRSWALNLPIYHHSHPHFWSQAVAHDRKNKIHDWTKEEKRGHPGGTLCQAVIPPYWEVSDEVGCLLDVILWGAPGTSQWEEAPETTQDILVWECLGILSEELDEVAGEREVRASLITQLPMWRNPGKAEDKWKTIDVSLLYLDHSSLFAQLILYQCYPHLSFCPW